MHGDERVAGPQRHCFGVALRVLADDIIHLYLRGNQKGLIDLVLPYDPV